jgi:hypothetical protein
MAPTLSEHLMSNTKKLWLGLATLLIVSFSVLLWAGGEIFRAAPPMPERVVAQDGSVVFTRADMEQGRQVWQSIGGMQLGSIWGHGGYVAPDWSADWLHREATGVLDLWARQYLRPGNADDHVDAGPRGRVVQCGRALREPVRQRPGHGGLARSVRDETGHGGHGGTPAFADRVLLVDGLGCHH